MNPRIHVRPIGNLGNQMLQFMLLESLGSRLPNVEVGGFEMPDWGLVSPLRQPLRQPPLTLIGQYIDLPLVESLLASGRVHELQIAALGFRMAHYLPRSAYLKHFPRRPRPLPAVVRDGLLINVRGAEILANTHEDYGPIPIAFYRQLVQQTGLEPVLMGQIADDAYSQALLKAFPGATVISSEGAMADFELIRSARHVVASVSTFSWLAAWLSDAETIHLPVFGIFNPLQRPDIDLLPLDDPRYRFYDFPVRHWSGTASQFDSLLEPQSFAELSIQALRGNRQRADMTFERLARRYRRRLKSRAWFARWTGRGMRVGAA